MSKTSAKTIFVFEQGFLHSCENMQCSGCKHSIEELSCIAYCKNRHFREIQDFCKENPNCGISLGHQCISFAKYTGIFQLSDGTLVHILPKIHKNSINKETEKERKKEKITQSITIFKNLLSTSRNFLKEIKENKETQSKTTKNQQLIEIYITVFCQHLKNILKQGIKKSYIRQQENLNKYKGKLKFSEHMKHNAANQARFFVEYSHFSMDIAENRLLKSACLLLLKHSAEEKNKKILKHFLLNMDEVSPCTNLEKDLQEKTVNRLHNHYEKPLVFAEFFLRKYGYYPRHGKSRLPSLLFPLNEMFEDYIASLFKNNGISFKPQYSRHCLIKDKDKPCYKTKMDFVIFDDNKKSAFILDAKWKIIDKDKLKPTWEENNFCVSQADLYQLFAYSEIIRNFDLMGDKEKRNITLALLYPKNDTFAENNKKDINEKNIIEWEFFNGTKLLIIPIDVNKPTGNAEIIEKIKNFLKKKD